MNAEPFPRDSTGADTAPVQVSFGASFTTAAPPIDAPDPDMSGYQHAFRYRDAEGRLIRYILRRDPTADHKKSFCPLTWGSLDGQPPRWHRRAASVPRCLYGLDRLAAAPDALVIVCEGEKAADAADRLLLIHACISWSGGSAESAIADTDWSPLAGRDVVIWPDNDAPGAKAAATLIALLRPIAASLRIVKVDDLPAKADAADIILNEGESAETWLESRLRPAPPVQAPLPEQLPLPLKRPLFRTGSPPREFPMAALRALRPAADAIQQRTQAPAAICAQSVLAAAFLVIQAHHDVVLPQIGQRPLVGLFVSVAESGERKSSVDRIALNAVHLMEEEWLEQAHRDMPRYLDECEAWGAARKKITKAARGDRKTIADGLHNLGPKPVPPPDAMVLIADPTAEALVLHLQRARPWGGLFTAEGGLLIGGRAFSDEVIMHTGALINELWDGSVLRRVRVGTGISHLPGRRCTMHLMMQGNVASRLMNDSTLNGIGTIARLMLVAPATTVGTRFWREPPPDAAEHLLDYDARLTAFLRRKPRYAADGLDPLPIGLTADATARLIAFHDEVERAIGPEGDYVTMTGFAAKLPEHAGRLAAVLTLYECPDASEVSDCAMEAGITLARFYATEMLRIGEIATVSPDLLLANKLLKWWQHQPKGPMPLPRIYQKGPPSIREATLARKIVAVLRDHGWVRPVAGTGEIWELVP